MEEHFILPYLKKMSVHAKLIVNILTFHAYNFQYSQSLMKTLMYNLLPGFSGFPVAQSLA